MNFAPYQWRAGEGYLPPPGSFLMPLYPQPVYQAPFYYPPFGSPAGPVIALPPPRLATRSEAPPAPPKYEIKKPAPKKEHDAQTVAFSLTPSSTPTCRPGVNYMHARAHTKLHIFNKAAPVWDEKYKDQQLAFKIFKVSTQFAVGEIIERVLKCKPEVGEGKPKWAVTEVVEGGGGEWLKGTTIEYGSDKAKGTLESMGWDERKGGGDVPPVWLVVHKL